MSSGYEDWDEIYRRNPLHNLPWERGKPREVLVELVESGRIKPCRALDVCCGAGTNDIYLSQRGFTVTASDVSERAIEYARKMAEKAGENIDFMVKSFLDLPFINEFDFVLDSGCFHHVHVEDRSAFIDGIHRVLKPGGMYLLICFSDENGPAWNHFTERQLHDLFSSRFSIVFSKHLGTVEGDRAVRYFHNMLMEKVS